MHGEIHEKKIKKNIRGKSEKAQKVTLPDLPYLTHFSTKFDGIFCFG